MPKRQICENLHFNSTKDKLILSIKQGKPFVFENALDNACKQWLEEGKSQDELEKLIKKQDSKYIIYKPLEVRAENVNKDIAQESKNNDTESRKSTQESSECDKESKESSRKTLYIQDELSFKNCVFNGEVMFEYICFALLNSEVRDGSEAKQNEKNPNDFRQGTQPLRIDFQHCEFYKRVYFTNCEFNANVFFNHAVFERYADFHESIFNGVVSFYNAEFKYAPNFSTCVFGNLQATNFINVKIESLDFGKVKLFIKEYRIELKHSNQWESLKQDNNRCEIIKEHKIRYASNARDSFRTIKNVLIANNNLLDACTWHKLELYAKEHELKLQKPCLLTAPKKWCDLWQLKFYRHTSAHHTDLLKILSWFVVLVGGFATILFFIKDSNSAVLWGSIFAVAFILLLLCALFKKINCFGFFTLLSLVPCAWLLAWNPKYIFGVANLFGNDKCQSDIFLNLILSLYSIAFILVIFSLQKTARKNSIIPN